MTKTLKKHINHRRSEKLCLWKALVVTGLFYEVFNLEIQIAEARKTDDIVWTIRRVDKQPLTEVQTAFVFSARRGYGDAAALLLTETAVNIERVQEELMFDLSGERANAFHSKFGVHITLGGCTCGHCDAEGVVLREDGKSFTEEQREFMGCYDMGFTRAVAALSKI